MLVSGADARGDINTLGRRSDTTAGPGGSPDAEVCEIYTDVTGLTLIRSLPKARKLQEITYDELLNWQALDRFCTRGRWNAERNTV